jgi:cation:H+ antiporter
MATEFALAGLGLVILLLAGDVLVKGAVNLSLRLGIPALIVSLTIVAFGTSAPELLISIKSILDGVPGLAMGNVVGSNTANILLVLGVPGDHLGAACRQRYAPHLCHDDHRHGPVHRAGVHGSVHLVAWADPCCRSWPMSFSTPRARHAGAPGGANGAPVDPEDLEEADPDMPWWRIGLYLLAGSDRPAAGCGLAGGQLDPSPRNTA